MSDIALGLLVGSYIVIGFYGGFFVIEGRPEIRKKKQAIAYTISFLSMFLFWPIMITVGIIKWYRGLE